MDLDDIELEYTKAWRKTKEELIKENYELKERIKEIEKIKNKESKERRKLC